MPRQLLLCALALTFTACSGQPKCGDPEDEETNCAAEPSGLTADTGALPERVELADAGSACVDGADPLLITVTLDDCISSCADDLQTECTAEVVGSELVVTATASYLPPPDGVDCPADCNVVQASCSIDAPTAGDYTLSYAGNEATFTVPLSGPVCSP